MFVNLFSQIFKVINSLYTEENRLYKKAYESNANHPPTDRCVIYIVNKNKFEQVCGWGGESPCG